MFDKDFLIFAKCQPYVSNRHVSYKEMCSAADKERVKMFINAVVVG